MGDFVKPEPHRLTLSDGQYIDIKKRLNHGETEDMYARWAPFVTAGSDDTLLDRREVRTAKVLAYLLGWSLTDDEGAPAPMSPVIPYPERLDTIRSLDPDRFDEIHKAITTYEAEYAAKKKAQAGANGSSPISPSPVAVTGATSGSLN